MHPAGLHPPEYGAGLAEGGVGEGGWTRDHAR